jgi:site-specific recombinase XerD
MIMALKLPKVINKKDINKMLSCINLSCPTGIRNYAIMLSMYRSGLRVQEVCDLKACDVDFENGLLYIQQSKGNKDRYTVLDNTTIEAFRKWDMIRPNSLYFFSTLKGGQLDQRYIREVCYRLSKKAGVYIQDGDKKKLVHPHTLRHSFATRSLNDVGMNIREVQTMLGHSSLSTTMIYTHVQPKELAEKYRQRSK